MIKLLAVAASPPVMFVPVILADARKLTARHGCVRSVRFRVSSIVDVPDADPPCLRLNNNVNDRVYWFSSDRRDPRRTYGTAHR